MLLFKPSTLKRKLFFTLFDMLIIAFSVYIAFLLRFNFEIPQRHQDSIFVTIAILTLLRLSLFYAFRVYSISWRHFGFRDTTRVVYVTAFSTLALVGISYMLRASEFIIPRSIIPIEFFLSLFLLLGLRVSKRLYLEKLQRNVDGKSTIVIGTIDNANTILRTINTQESPYYPVAVINEEYNNIKVNGVEVYDIETFISKGVECEVAILDTSSNVALIYEKLVELGIKSIKTASEYGDYGAEIKNISVEDLLARHPQDLDKEKIASFIKNRVVLISGAGGSIGSEIARQCASFGAKKLILLDNSEYNLYAISEEISSLPIVSVMQSVTMREELEETFKLYSPQIVIHAAAYKHVPLVEENIHEAIVNNIRGTQNIIDLSIAHNVEKLVMISTDKAVRPTNVMGTTKRICELYAQNVDAQKTEIVAVRFGNVLGSSGSVIPKFQAQIESGKNITVTHPEITRYFMLIPEACELVLQAAAIGGGGEIFILDMGEPIKIVDLAQKMIDLSGKRGIEIEFTGLRAGEKLYEELLIDERSARTEYDSITVASPTPYAIEQLKQDIEELLQTKEKLQKLKEIVPEFHHQPR